MSQEELADKLNVSRQLVSKRETGDSSPGVLKLKQLSQPHDVSTNYIVGNKNPDKKEGTQEASKRNLLKRQRAKRVLKDILWGTTSMLTVPGTEVLKQDSWVVAIFAAVPSRFLTNYYIDNKG